MAGIGKYTKGKAFKLKSGNSPLFKHMGSPITMNNFGVGKGTSPYKQEPDSKSKPTDPNPDEEAPAEKKKGSGWKKAAGVALSGLAGGLNAVYGSKIPSPKSSDRLKKDDGEVLDKGAGETFGGTETPEQKKKRLAKEAKKVKK